MLITGLKCSSTVSPFLCLYGLLGLSHRTLVQVDITTEKFLKARQQVFMTTPRIYKDAPIFINGTEVSLTVSYESTDNLSWLIYS